jgi:hypothetical protein
MSSARLSTTSKMGRLSKLRVVFNLDNSVTVNLFAGLIFLALDVNCHSKNIPTSIDAAAPSQNVPG